jgi:hypothetical protein
MIKEQYLKEIKDLYYDNIKYLEKPLELSESDKSEYESMFKEIKDFPNIEAIKYCINKFAQAEMDYITSGERGLGRASTFYPRFGAYLRKTLIRLNDKKRCELSNLLEENILSSYLAHSLEFSSILPSKEFITTELYEKWIPVIYIGENYISEEHYNFIMSFTAYSATNLMNFLKENNISSGGMFSKDRTKELISMHLVAGLKLRAVEIKR